ncbi:MAG TPA: hypothetical protein PK738_04910 [Bacteroidales bacterium]|nr:hypothetical protein [Bacteroidales bacterium]
MPTRVIELPTRWYRKRTIGYIGERELYVQSGHEPTSQRPRGIWGFKVACTSEEVVFDDPDASRIASEIATALIYIADERLPPWNPPVQGHPEIRVEPLGDSGVKISNGDRGILIPCALVRSLGQVLENL